MLIHDAAVTFVVVYDAFVNWLIFLAVTVTIVALAAVATGAWGVQALRRWVHAPQAATDSPEVAPVLHDAPKPVDANTAPHVPSWARTEEEAA